MSTTDRFELVFSQAAWESALPRLLTDPSLLAVGHVRRNEHPGARELLVSHLDTTAAMPHGNQFPPLTDWIVVACPAGTRADPTAWLRELEPRASQLLAVALLGAGANRGQWRAEVFQGKSQTPVASIRVVGPGMPRADATAGVPEFASIQGPRAPARSSRILANSATPAGDDRWLRTRGALGVVAFKKLQRANVLLLAAGGSGSAIAWQLAALGVRQLRIVDPDVIEASNLDRMFAVGEADVGAPKAQAVGRHLLSLRPDLALGILTTGATDAAVWQAARDADLVVTAADNGTPDLVAAILCRKLLKPHLSVGSGITSQNGRTVVAADARLLLPMQGCAVCVGGLVDEDQARYELRAPIGTMRRGEPADAGRLGSLVTLNSMNVSIGVQCWLDLLAGNLRGSFWHRLEWVPGEGMRVDAGVVGAAADCVICHNGATRGIRLRAEPVEDHRGPVPRLPD